MFFVVYVCFLFLVFVPAQHSFDFRKNHSSLKCLLKSKCSKQIIEYISAHELSLLHSILIFFNEKKTFLWKQIYQSITCLSSILQICYVAIFRIVNFPFICSNFPSPPHCSQVSFLWQATGYQLLGASPAASPPSPSLPSLPHSLSPAAQGPSSRWEIRHHDTNKLSPYFKKAQQGSVCACVCVCHMRAKESMPLRECVCVMHICTLVCLKVCQRGVCV